MSELELSPDVFERDFFALIGFAVGAERAENPFARGESRLYLSEHARNLVEGLGVLVGVGEEARQPAYGEVAHKRRDDRQ